MIALNRPSLPGGYANIVVADLVARFKADGARVWDLQWLKDALLDMSGHKCAYCETSLRGASVYAEVEHYRHKDAYPDDVITWTNLLPSCRSCNGTKSTHDVVAEPIIDPTVIDPRGHLRLQNYQFVEKTPLGQKTLEVLQFNYNEKLMTKRFQLGLAAANDLREAAEFIPANAPFSPAQVRKVRNKMLRVVAQAAHDQPYAATIATILISDPTFNRVKTFLTAQAQWTPELASAETAMSAIVLN